MTGIYRGKFSIFSRHKVGYAFSSYYMPPVTIMLINHYLISVPAHALQYKFSPGASAHAIPAACKTVNK